MKTHNKKPSPVSQGDFGDGPDTLLWNPTLGEVSLRRKTVRAFATDNTLLVVLFGVGSVVLGIAWATGGAATLLLAVGVIAVVFGVFAVAGEFSTSADEYRLAVWGRLQKRPGEFFYRTNDFADLNQLSQRILGFQDRYNATAAPFDWTYTRDDLNAFLRRLDLHDTPPTRTHAA